MDDGGIEGGHDRTTVLGHSVAGSLSDPETEASALRGGAALLAAPWERLLDVSGADSASFLHNLLTQHIRGLEIGRSTPSALATRKGHLVADLTVFRAGAERFRLRMPSLVATDVLEVLEKHQIMEDVAFHWALERPGAFLLVGPGAERVGEAVGPDLPVPGSAMVPVREITGSDRVLLFESEHLDRVRELCLRAGAVPIGWRAFDRRRVELGRAWFGLDADGERLVPEPGFHDRIHYDKGCYLGQEPLARLHYRGRPNWALVRLEGGIIPGLSPGADLFDSAGDRIGWITSVAPGQDGVVALGYLHRRFRDAGERTVRTEGGQGLAWLPD